MKPKLKPPCTKRLKVDNDEPLSSFPSKFNLRRYTMLIGFTIASSIAGEVGQSRLTLSNPR